MRRYWIEPQDKAGDTVVFRGEIHHHIFDVCRQEQGSRFEVLTDEGKAFLVEVTRLDRKSAEAHVLEERQIPPLKNPLLRMVISIPRFPVMDAVLEKAVELGVKSVHPVFSQFSFVRNEASLSDNKFQRWEKIIRSATQQSGRGERMELVPPQTLENFLKSFNRNPQPLGLFAYEGPSTLSIKDELQRRRQLNPEVPQEVWFFVGSEGGFSHQEVELFRQHGLQPVTLGPQVLRVETACMAMVSVLKYDFDLMC